MTNYKKRSKEELERLEAECVAIYLDNPSLTCKQIATMTGVDYQTVGKYIKYHRK